ncbi:DUF1801 domain-containing protein [Cellulomonas endometrii]|uniref:DUF1801 domain-containing protein n=1 Tax=Cellulomonas endometrii TaxID=3036301 RepID=UPI0024ACB832|nr:DUF1801 domain-containing protein [Cellulomonas endometrii]
MAETAKTAPTEADVHAFLAEASPAARRRDAGTLLALLERVTGEQPVMWGPSIVGFGRYAYRYGSGRTGEWPAASFSPRKAATTVYLMDGVEAHADDLAALGPHTVGKGCLYLKDLEQVDLAVLERVLARSWRTLTAEPPGGVTA